MDAFTPSPALNAAELRQLEQRLADAALPFAVATVVRALPPTSAWVGAQALIEADGTLHGWIGGGCSRALVIDAARDALATGQPKLVRISNTESAGERGIEHHAMPCASNGTLELFIQPSVPAPLVLILGATPAALEACVLAQRVGLRVCAAANAIEPFAAFGIARVERGYEPAVLDALHARFVLVATQGDGDEAALEAALRTSAEAVLLIASAAKAERLRDAMRLRGIAEARLAALHAPAGPTIHARTPEEIALGAVAGLVALRRATMPVAQPSADAASMPAIPPCEALASHDAPRYRNPVCGMMVDIATAKHVVDADGERVYFCCDGCKLEFERAPQRYVAIARDAHRQEA